MACSQNSQRQLSDTVAGGLIGRIPALESLIFLYTGLCFRLWVGCYRILESSQNGKGTSKSNLYYKWRNVNWCKWLSGDSELRKRRAKFWEQVWSTSSASSHQPWTFHCESPVWKEGLPFCSVSRYSPYSHKTEIIAICKNVTKNKDNY